MTSKIVIAWMIFQVVFACVVLRPTEGERGIIVMLFWVGLGIILAIKETNHEPQ